MPVTLRKRLQCHGCGKRLNTASRIRHGVGSSPSPSPSPGPGPGSGHGDSDGDSKIRCDTCLTDNYFDPHLNPIDVPVAEAASPAHQNHQHAGYEVESTSTSFCNTCLKNQFLYITALSDYLPDDDHPDYAELEANLPNFKKELDLRYPQCCAQCEPRVSSSLEHANYNAKTDHLRRVMARRKMRQSMGRFNIRSVIIRAAGAGYILSLSVQLLWHILAAQAVPRPSLEHDMDDGIIPFAQPVSPTTLQSCLRQWPIAVGCADVATPWIPVSLALGLLCIWWNPHWQQRFKGREGRLTGLRRYYVLQVAILVVRFSAWIAAGDLAGSSSYLQILHAVTAALVTMLTIYALFASIVVDTTPLVDWAKVQRPLTHPDQFRLPASTTVTPPQSQDTLQFAMNHFAGPVEPDLEPWRPPTPPDSTDAMEWTSSAHNFNPQPRVTRQRLEQPNPFYGNLPAAPTRGSLHPKRQPPPPPKQSLGISPGFFGLSKPQNPGTVEHSPAAQPVFVPAKFFATERDADTGLENIFDKMFSVRDPLERGTARRLSRGRKIHSRLDSHGRTISRGPSVQKTGNTDFWTLRFIWNCSTVLVLAAVAFTLSWTEYMHGGSSREPTTVLVYTIVVPLFNLFQDTLLSGPATSSQLTTSAISLLVPVCGYLLLPAQGSPFAPSWNKVAIGLLLLMMLHEIYNLCQLQTLPISPTATSQMIESMRVAESHNFDDISATSHPSPPPTMPVEPLAPSPIPQQQWQQPSFQRSAFSNQYQQNPSHQPSHSSDGRSIFGDYAKVRKRDSDESISSVSSIQTTSTAPGWKTPRNESRTFDFQDNGNRYPSRRPSNNLSRGLGGLSLSNDFGIGTGAGVAGPRTRQQDTFGRYR